jgi:hypothetical protein
MVMEALKVALPLRDRKAERARRSLEQSTLAARPALLSRSGRATWKSVALHPIVSCDPTKIAGRLPCGKRPASLIVAITLRVMSGMTTDFQIAL